MISGSAAPTHFGSYEILRIVIPGLYFIFVLFVFIAAFSIPLFPLDAYDFRIPTFFMGMLLAGLTLYAKESPKKRKAFQQNQPSEFLFKRSRIVKEASPLTEDDSRRLYFYILNTYMPSTFHDKIFFFGMIYHIMISIRRTSFWFGLTGLVLLGVYFSRHGQIVLDTVVPVVGIWLIYAVNVRYNKADRKMQENFQDQIFWLSMNTKLIDGLLKRYMTNTSQ
jgi:hypothetical protein